MALQSQALCYTRKMSKNKKPSTKKWVAMLIFPWACVLTSIILETVGLDILKLKSGSTELGVFNITSIILLGLFFIGLIVMMPIAIIMLNKSSKKVSG